MPKNRIIVFSDGDGFEKATKIRNLLKKIGILNIMMVDLDYILEKLTYTEIDKPTVTDTEGLNAMRRSSEVLPIIFYGGSENRCKLLIKLLGLTKRKNIGWILNPMNGKILLEGMKHLEQSKK